MKLLKSILFLPLFISLIFFSCKKEETDTASENFECITDNSIAKSNRNIGIDLLDLSQSNSFEDNILLAKELGVEFIALHMPWSSIESSPNNFIDPFDAIFLLGKVAAENDMKFSLTIRPIDLVGKTVPSDLENMRFNSMEMIDRFKAVTDFIFTKVDPSVLLNFQIGNEIDGYDTSNEHSDFWSDYGEFINAISNHIHSINPNLKVGFTGTFSGLMENQNTFKTLLENVDILGVTYYPIKSNFDVKDPSVVFEDFNDLVNSFNKTIYLQEVGYQSGALNNSDEEKQAEFFCNFFKAWDTHADKIKSANILRLNDLSKIGATESAGPYGISNPEFIEYLRTLGVRTFDGKGKEKKAFEVIKNNLRERGW